MNQYKRLLSNTFIFAVGTFSSKILVILMLRFYTGVLTQDEMGVADLIIKTTSILYPVVSLSIGQAVIRYGLERRRRKPDVFTIGLLTVACGFLISLPFNPLLKLAIYLPRGFPAFHHLRIFGDRQQFFQPASGTVDTRDYCFRFFLHQNSPADVVSIPYGDYFPQKVNGWQQEKKRSRIITCRILRASGPRIRL